MRSVDLSPIEERVILKLRAVLDNQHGELTVKVRGGRVNDIVSELPDGRQLLDELQKDFTASRGRHASK